ncbi:MULTISPECIES: hypothetical protein [unclassified Streptomyces]|uniref:hypothetical protein n=1 Tax=unclassified Streptomyces TaxID=2593676 RepID=UPI003803B34D
MQQLNADGELSNRGLKAFSTTSVAWDENKRMFHWAAHKASIKGDARVCSEDHCDEEAVRNGSAKEVLQHTEINGARSDEKISSRVRCQQSRELDQFRASEAEMRENGRLWLQQQNKASTEAQEEAMTAAEEEAEGLAQGFSQALEDE